MKREPVKLVTVQCVRCGISLIGMPGEVAECQRCYKLRKVSELTKQIEKKRQQFAASTRKS